MLAGLSLECQTRSISPISMALRGIRVLEFAGLAPVPFCGMILADFGAEVIRVDRAGGELTLSGNELLGRGKKSIVLNLKHPKAISIIEKLIPTVCVHLLRVFSCSMIDWRAPRTTRMVDPAFYCGLCTRLTSFSSHSVLASWKDLN
jgi:hypothetical protein